MPAYNAGKFVIPSVKSMWKQTYTNLELIIVDDGSSDDTWEKLKALKKESPIKMRIYRFRKNQGETAAANFAFTKSKGEYIARMDADDVAKVTRIEKQMRHMEQYPRAVLVGAQANVINGRGKVIGTKHVPTDPEAIYTSFGFYQPLVHSTIIFRRTLLPKRTNLYNNTYELANDYHTFFELLNYGEFHNLAEELVSYRVHNTNKSLSKLKEIFWQDVKIRILATTRMGYKASVLMFPVIAAQSALVSLFPEKILLEIFYFLRGLKKPHPRFHRFFLRLKAGTIKRYALSA